MYVAVYDSQLLNIKSALCNKCNDAFLKYYSIMIVIIIVIKVQYFIVKLLFGIILCEDKVFDFEHLQDMLIIMHFC